MISKFVKITLLLFIFVIPTISAADLLPDSKTKSFFSYDKKNGKPKVFIEGVYLDFDYLRRNMKFIDFVNDPAVSDVHIIISRRISGSGGKVYSLMYNNNTFENFSNYTLTCATASSDTNQEIRKKLKDAISMGLMPFVNQTDASSEMTLRYKGKEENTDIPVDDPWNSWTFRGTFNGSVDLEESRKSFNYLYNLRADKVTED